MIAVIKTGGKQYLVSPGENLRIEKIEGEIGKEITFGEVLLLERNKKTEIGTPFLKGVKVIGKILEQDRADKIIVFHYKNKTRRRTKRGHRQPFTKVEIQKIETE